MKLAQALSERADIQRRIQQLQQRLGLNARVQEGESPAEDPQELLKELNGMLCGLEQLVLRINLTNASEYEPGHTITELLAKRDCLQQQVCIMQGFLAEASATAVRGTKTEIKIVSTVPVAKLRKQTDEFSRQLRELDVKIQELNWTVELK